MLEHARTIAILAGLLGAGCDPVVMAAESASSGASSTAGSSVAGGSGGSTTAGAGGTEMVPPGVRLSQGRPWCLLHGGTVTCYDAPPGADAGASGPWDVPRFTDAVDPVALPPGERPKARRGAPPPGLQHRALGGGDRSASASLAPIASAAVLR